MNLLKKMLSASLCVTLSAGLFAGCSGGNDAKRKEGSDYTSLLSKVSDSSELPDWDGEPLKLKYWQANSDKSAYKEYKNDVVRPEIKRVTGVEIDEDDSFGNGSGNTADTKLGFMQMANDYPQLVTCHNDLVQLVNKDLLWDLTDYLPKYCPNIMAKFPKELAGVWENTEINGGKSGKIYGIPLCLMEDGIFVADKDMTPEKYSWFAEPYESRGYVWVRDDVLKKVYPEAKTSAEIEQMYMDKGSFTKDDILDVSIKSKEEFADFLRKIKDLHVKENGSEISPTYLYNGIDNWYLMNYLTGDLTGSGHTNDYFTYYNKAEKKVKYAFKEDEFVDMLKYWSSLLNEGLASKESLIDSTQILTEKLIGGQYAVSYSYQNPNSLQGSKYSWRKVYIDIEPDYEKYYHYKTPIRATLPISVFKSTVSESELIQILKYFDFMVSDVGQNLVNWGPKSAGLWTEENGVRKFKDKALEDFMVYNTPDENAESYGLQNGLDVAENGIKPTYMRYSRNPNAPAIVYSHERRSEDAQKMFSLGMVEPDESRIEAYSSLISRFSKVSKGAEKAWSARKTFEDGLLKVISASDDASFKKYYDDFVKNVEIVGYDDTTLKEINDHFWDVNGIYKNNFK